MAAPPPPCPDRLHHVPPVVGAGVAAHYAHHLGPGAGPGAACGAVRTQCSQEHRRGADTSICNVCVDHTQVILELHPFVGTQANLNRIGVLTGVSPTAGWTPLGPPWIFPHPPLEWINPPWPGFLTRVCTECERMIQSFRYHVNAGNIIVPAAELAQWQAPANNSCKCRFNLGVNGPGPRRCYPHQEQLWQDIVRQKDRNDIWLRNIERRRGNNDIIFDAKRTTKRNRVRDRTWRACRCGRECPSPRPALGVPVYVPEAWLCMACEGWVSTVDPALGGRFIGQWLSTRQLGRACNFKLGREVRHQ